MPSTSGRRSIKFGAEQFADLHFYAICAEQVEGKRVLDLGCGRGSGTAILARTAAMVVGADQDSQAVLDAKALFSDRHLDFIATIPGDLPFESRDFDVVVARLDGAQHDTRETMLNEIGRLLTVEGFAMLSIATDLELGERNKIQSDLAKHFAHVRLVGIRVASVSLGYPLQSGPDNANLPTARTYRGEMQDERRPKVDRDTLSFAEPDLVIAICSNHPVPHELADASLLFSDDVRLDLRHSLEPVPPPLRAHLALTSRLLSNMLSKAVEEDEQSVIESMFLLNQQHMEQRLKLIDAERASAGLLAMQKDFDEMRRKLDMETNNVSALQADVREQREIRRRLQAQLTASELARGNADLAISAEIEARNRIEEQFRGLQADHMRLRTDYAQLSEVRANLDREHSATRASLLKAEAEAVGLREIGTTTMAEMRETREQSALAQLDFVKIRIALESRIDDMESSRALQSEQEEKARLELERRLAEAREAALSERESFAITQSEFEARLIAEQQASAIERERLLELEKQLATASTEERERERNIRADLEESLSKARSEIEQYISEIERLKSQREASARLPAPPSKTMEHISTPDVRTAPTRQRASGRSSAVPAERTKQREIERFSRTHQNVRDQIEAAKRDLAGKIPKAVPKPRKASARILAYFSAPIKTPLFDANWIKRQAPEIGKIDLATYLRTPTFWAIDPHPLFAASTYLSNNPDIAHTNTSPLRHYVEHGWREGREPHPEFANDWYLAQNRDVLASCTLSPLEHYLEYGWREGRWPNPLFDPVAYLKRYPDVAAADMEPLTHFIAYGKAEGREPPSRLFNTAWEALLPPGNRGNSIYEFMLGNRPLPVPAGTADKAPDFWPPDRLDDFWISQQLRDFIIEGYGEESLQLYWYLCSVMNRYHERVDDFPRSADCMKIVERARQTAKTLAAKLPAQPTASIIIPVYNNIMDTLLCITSVLEHETFASFEIIVADDGSSDATAELITSIGGVVRYIRQPMNYGFVGNCNAAARQAQGEYIVLLNNDTLVLPHWLDALIAPFDTHARVGLVGSKLVNWDGSLQEAGGIYWKDGSAWNFGRGGRARAPEFSYLKDVDYISGASIMMPAALWRELGGFDELYAPAYCEDADIAFRLREQGYRTVLNPASEVIHHEGRSHGRDLDSGIKAYQMVNQQRLFERWRPVLEKEHYPNAHNVLRARDRSGEKPHVLVIDHYVPQWDQDAGSRSTYFCIKAFLDLGFSVTFWPDNLWRDPRYTPALQALGVEVIYGDEYQGRFAEFISDRADLYDAAFINRPHVAEKYLESLRGANGIHILYYGHDLHFRRMTAARELGEEVTTDAIAEMKAVEFKVCRQSDVVLYPDPEEVAIMQKEAGSNALYAALPVYVFDAQQIEQGARRLSKIQDRHEADLLFVGGFNHTPNRDGIAWFIRDVLPIVRSQIGPVRLRIAGSKPPAEIMALAGKDIEVLGFVSDERLTELYDEASLGIAPLRYGAGVKGKVIEAMAAGVPMATTTTGAQGIEKPEDKLFIGSDAESLADAIVLGIRDRKEAHGRAIAALDFIKERHSTGILQDLLKRFAHPDSPRRSPRNRS